MRTRLIALPVIILLFLWSCSNNPDLTDPLPPGETATISFAFSIPPEIQSLVSTAEAIVSASDMDTIFQTLTVSPNSVSGIIEAIPAGDDRKFEVNVYDSSGVLTYSGEAISKVLANQTITLDIILYPQTNTGTVIINGTFYQGDPTDGKIVFLRDTGSSDDIVIMNGDLSNLVQLTTTSEQESNPHISSDYSKICFTRQVGGLIRPFIMNADGSNEVALSFHAGANVTHMVWSPDAEDIVLSSDFSGAREIYIYNVASEDLTQLTFNGARNWLPSWSPDGQKIGWASDQTGIFRTYTMNRDGSNQMRLTTTTNLEERTLVYSPDGNTIVFAARTGSAWDLYKIDADGTNLEQVTNTPGVNEHHHTWSPDGRFILAAELAGSNYGLYLYDMQNNFARQLYLDDPNIQEDHPHWR